MKERVERYQGTWNAEWEGRGRGGWRKVVSKAKQKQHTTNRVCARVLCLCICIIFNIHRFIYRITEGNVDLPSTSRCVLHDNTDGIIDIHTFLCEHLQLLYTQNLTELKQAEVKYLEVKLLPNIRGNGRAHCTGIWSSQEWIGNVGVICIYYMYNWQTQWIYIAKHSSKNEWYDTSHLFANKIRNGAGRYKDSHNGVWVADTPVRSEVDRDEMWKDG